MTSIFNTRKINKDFGQYASNLVAFIDGKKGYVNDSDIFDLALAEKLREAGVLNTSTRGFGWSNEWSVNYRYMLDNGYFSKRGEELAAAGKQRHEEYFAAVNGGDLVQYYAKWGNAAGREYIMVP